MSIGKKHSTEKKLKTVCCLMIEYVCRQVDKLGGGGVLEFLLQAEHFICNSFRNVSCDYFSVTSEIGSEVISWLKA